MVQATAPDVVAAGNPVVAVERVDTAHPESAAPAPAPAPASLRTFTPEQIETLQNHAIAYAVTHGVMIAQVANPNETASFTHLPLSLLPVPLPRVHFQHALTLSPICGLLVDRVSRDLDWLHPTLDRVVQGDAFTARLLQLSREVQAKGIHQRAYLGIFRSDYMLHEPVPDVPNDTQRLLQVELNTISSGFGCMSTRMSQLHRHMIDRFADDVPAIPAVYQLPAADLAQRLPANDGLNVIARAVAQAHQHYGNPDAIVLFIVQPREWNAVDQRGLEFALWANHRIRVVRKTLTEIDAQGTLQDCKNRPRALVIEGREVSVAYYRAGYTPRDYPTEREWAARTKIEHSLAIKCPSIAYHLAGTKKVQQMLAAPATLRRFLSEEDARLLEVSFAGLHGLDQDASSTASIVAMARANPARFVLKPQREGGGNNLYGAEMVQALERMSPNEREAYILMERIVPAETQTLLVRDGKTTSGPTTSELGMFIATLFDDGRALVNEHAGHLLRTKWASTNECGVSAGFAVVSSPLLV